MPKKYLPPVQRKRAAGAGAPTLSTPDDPTRNQMVTMPESLWALAREIGDGKASPGIRLALQKFAKKKVS